MTDTGSIVIELESGYNEVEFYRPQNRYHRIKKISLNKKVLLTLTKSSPKGLVSPLIISNEGDDLSRYSHMFVLYRDSRTELTIDATEDCILTIEWIYDHDMEKRDLEYSVQEKERKRKEKEYYMNYGGIHYYQNPPHIRFGDYDVHPDDIYMRMMNHNPEVMLHYTHPDVQVNAGKRYVVPRDGITILTGIIVISGNITEIEITIGQIVEKINTVPGRNPLQNRLLLPLMHYHAVEIYPNADGVIRYDFKYVPSAIINLLANNDVIYDGIHYRGGLCQRCNEITDDIVAH